MGKKVEKKIVPKPKGKGAKDKDTDKDEEITDTGKTEDSEEEIDEEKIEEEDAEESDDEDDAEDSEGDYLQKYQYGKDKPLGHPSTNPQAGSKAEKMKQSLLAQPKIRMLIPVIEGSSPEIPYSVNLNGYRLDFPTNTYVDVPEQISDLVRASHNQTEVALSRDRIGKDKEDKLS